MIKTRCMSFLHLACDSYGILTPRQRCLSAPTEPRTPHRRSIVPATSLDSPACFLPDIHGQVVPTRRWTTRQLLMVSFMIFQPLCCLRTAKLPVVSAREYCASFDVTVPYADLQYALRTFTVYRHRDLADQSVYAPRPSIVRQQWRKANLEPPLCHRSSDGQRRHANAQAPRIR